MEASTPRASALGEVTWRDHMALAAITDRFMAGGDPAALADDARRFVEARPVFRNRAQAELALALSLGDLGDFRRATNGVLRRGVDGDDIDRGPFDPPGGGDGAVLDGGRAAHGPSSTATLATALGPGWFGITAGAAAAAALARFELGQPVTRRHRSRRRCRSSRPSRSRSMGCVRGATGTRVAAIGAARRRRRPVAAVRPPALRDPRPVDGGRDGRPHRAIRRPVAGSRPPSRTARSAGLVPIARRAAMARHALGRRAR